MQDTPRTEFLPELGVFRIIWIRRFLFGIQVVEVAKKLIEAVYRRKKLVAIAEVVLPKLAGNVTRWFQHFGNRRVFGLQPKRRTRQANLCKTGPDWRLARDERRTSCGAALLSVPVCKHRALFRDAVDVWGPVSHH